MTRAIVREMAAGTDHQAGVGSGIGGGVNVRVEDAGVGHEQDRHVPVSEVLTQAAGSLGPVDEFEETIARLGAAGLQCLGIPERTWGDYPAPWLTRDEIREVSDNA